MKFLTEPEVADRLRCSVSKVKRLRLSGRLPFINGRPVLIDEADLLSFIASEKQGATVRPMSSGSFQVDVPAQRGPSTTEAPGAIAQRLWQLRQLRTQYRKS